MKKLNRKMYTVTKVNLSSDLSFEEYVKSLTSNYSPINSEISVKFSVKKNNGFLIFINLT